MIDWDERARKEIAEVGRRVEVAIAAGASPTEAINRNAYRAEAYEAMLKKYGLKPVIPD